MLKWESLSEHMHMVMLRRYWIWKLKYKKIQMRIQSKRIHVEYLKLHTIYVLGCMCCVCVHP